MTERNDERNEDKIEGAKIEVKSPVLRWLDNFFYHYKWHTVIALVLTVAIVLCSVQMCTKTTYDSYVLYAGATNLRGPAKDGDVSDYQKVVSALKQYSDDFNGDGEHNLNFVDLYLPSEEDMRNTDNDAIFARVSQDSETFRHYMYYGSYQLCLLSEHLYLEWTKDREKTPLAEIAPYIPEGSTLKVAEGGFGVYLSSSPLYEKAGFNLLSDDTVICIRIMSMMSDTFDRDENLENFERSEQMLRRMLGDMRNKNG